MLFTLCDYVWNFVGHHQKKILGSKKICRHHIVQFYVSLLDCVHCITIMLRKYCKISIWTKYIYYSHKYLYPICSLLGMMLLDSPSF